ncbi:MAG: hypothetical protein AAF205_11825 [Pseudomonadota bacterium]
MTCTACKFYQSAESECRRYAPSPAEGDKKAHWPTVASSDWCGEFVAAEGERKAA